MVVIGIDMSKNSPAVCIRNSDELSFLSFIRGSNKGKVSSHYKTLIDSGVSMNFYEFVQPSNMDYSISEVWKANDAMRYAKWIASNLPDADFVGIEGFSYGSSGNSFIDVVGYGYAIRMTLIEKYGIDKVCVFSPGNVKKTAGKGNANKDLMMEFFLNESNKELTTNLFWNSIHSGVIDKSKKPIDDLIDSYYVQKCAHNLFTEKV